MIDYHELCTIALTCIKHFSQHHALELYKQLHYDVTPIFDAPESQWHAAVPQVPLAWMGNLLTGREAAMERAKREAEFIEEHHVQVLCYGTKNYPTRLQDCPDAPLVLYYMGNADLNSPYMLSVVGTRHATAYGKDFCARLTQDFSRLLPQTVVVSGLAYGIDINAHRGALANGLPTVAVLAHGLDRIYPSYHRDTAKMMLSQGGLLTEYKTGTIPDKGNFVQRNRIVAGLSDGCLIVESGTKGGSLITARLASDYHREVLAVPGRVGDEYSEGCNRLIAQNQAVCACSAESIAEQLGWPVQFNGTAKERVVQTELFEHLTDEEAVVARLLAAGEGQQLNQLVVRSELPVHRLTAILFELELRGLVQLMPGGCYRWLRG